MGSPVSSLDCDGGRRSATHSFVKEGPYLDLMAGVGAEVVSLGQSTTWPRPGERIPTGLFKAMSIKRFCCTARCNR